jgi:F-box and leucine-rich repeat protein GRR1
MIKIIDRLPTEEEYPRVRHLILQFPGQANRRIVDDELATVLGKCLQLESIVLSGIPDLSDRTITLLAQTAPNLQGINLNGCSQITDAGILALVARPLPLQWVRLNGVANLTDESLSAIATSCPRLVDLELCDLPLITPLSVKTLWTQLR